MFIKCECHSEGMGVDYDPEDELYYFSYWSEGLSNKRLTWKEKFRYCWNIFRKGKAFNDEVILDQRSVDDLVTFLEKKRNGFPVGNNIDFGTSME